MPRERVNDARRRKRKIIIFSGNLDAAKRAKADGWLRIRLANESRISDNLHLYLQQKLPVKLIKFNRQKPGCPECPSCPTGHASVPLISLLQIFPVA